MKEKENSGNTAEDAEVITAEESRDLALPGQVVALVRPHPGYNGGDILKLAHA